MKKLTVFLSVMLLGIMVSTFTSCLSDDDDDYKTYSQEEMRAFMRQIDGNYTGKLYFYNDTISATSKVDSVAASARITASDSTIILSDVSPRVFSKYFLSNVYDGSTGKTVGQVNPQYENLSKALNELPNQQLILRHVFYDVVESGLIYYGVYPMSKTFRLNYDGAEHTLTFNFFASLNSNGQYYNRRTAFSLYVYDISIDNYSYRSYSIYSSEIMSNVMTFVGNAM